MLYRVLKPLTFAVLRVLFRMRVVGVESVPREGPALIAANHVSLLDPPVVGAGVPRPLQFMAKAELFRVPLLGGLIRRLNAYPVEREGADAGALRHALLLLREGKALLVFPEGTRGTEGVLGRGRAGAGMLAALSEAPVVPVYVEGTGRVLPRGASRPRRARITVRYGAPLYFERGRGKHRYQEISDQIMAAIGRLKAEAEEGGSGFVGARNPRADGDPRGERRLAGSVGARDPGAEGEPHAGRRLSTSVRAHDPGAEGDRGAGRRPGPATGSTPNNNAERTVRGPRPAGQIH